MSDAVITLEDRNDRLIVRIQGVLRLRDAEDFDPEIQRIAEQDAEVVVLDLSKLEFIGSAGIGALVRMDKALRKQETRVRIACASEGVASIFKTSRLDAIFPFFDTLEQALA